MIGTDVRIAVNYKLDLAGTGQESSFFPNCDAFESSPDTAF